jgi:DNA repair protein RadC
MLIRSKPPFERPRERCLRQGSQSLSVRECLAVLFGSGPKTLGALGLAENVLSVCRPRVGSLPETSGKILDFRGGSNELFDEDVIALAREVEEQGFKAIDRIKGLGPSGRARLRVLFRFSDLMWEYRNRKIDVPPHPSIEDLLRLNVPFEFRTSTLERLGFLGFDSMDRPIGFEVIATGGTKSVTVDRLILAQRLVGSGARRFVLVHNHPSQNPTPSDEDHNLSREVAFLARVLGLQFSGHWIVTADRNVPVV